METIKVKSESLSFRGWKFKVWLKRNKETVKNLIVAGVGISVFFLPQVEDVALSAALASLSSIVAKLVTDSFDFWVSEVELKTVNVETGKIVEDSPPDPRPPPAPYNKV